MEKSPSSSGLLFIDVDAKQIIPVFPTIKEERASSPDETLSNVKKETKTKLKCKECDVYSCYSNDKLIRHIRRAHRGQKAFQCSLCEYATTNSVRFEEHVNIHQGIKPYKCKHCSYSSVSRKYLKYHETNHSVCDKCGYLAQNVRALKKHTRLTGCNPQTIQKMHECGPCKRKFESKLAVQLHQKRHKKCPYCNEAFCRSVLTVHMSEKHGFAKTKTHKNKFECAQCEWTSVSKHKILLHMIHHPKQKLDGKFDVTPLIESGILVDAT